MSRLFVAILLIGWCAAPATAQEDAPRPPGEVTAQAPPYGVGDRLIVSWTLSPDDPEAVEPPEEGIVTGYRILRSSDTIDRRWVALDEVPIGTTAYEDRRVRRGRRYHYQVVALGEEEVESAPVQTDEAVSPRVAPFDARRSWFGLMLVAICGAVLTFIVLVRQGRPLKIRRIAGLEVVDEAVGRATEMGRSCLFVPGIQDMNEIQTVAGITILNRVARTAAEYDAAIEVPTARALVMTTAQETVESAYLSAGRPDAFNQSRIYFVTDEQFGYVAYLSGWMVREKPAACFYMGAFFAESLILAETGNSIGAIQVAGTAEPAQLPFFVAACDYTLIGEEFFAASAYLSGEPDQLGSLKGQDMGKLIVAALMLGGCLLATWAMLAPDHDRVQAALQYLTENVLTTRGVE